MAATPVGAWRPRKGSGDRTPAAAGPQQLTLINTVAQAQDDAVASLVSKAAAGLAAGAPPKLEGTGTGGAYRLATIWGSPLAILKPRSEEAFAEHNPRGLRSPGGQDEGFRSGAVLPGTGADREVAAYLLDHGNFAGVPPTALVQVQHPRLAAGQLQQASLQEFVAHQGPASDFSPSLFKAESVHRVAQLDLRLLNLDRNDANLLVRPRPDPSERLELTPIDHGLCLPDHVAMSPEGVAWMTWPCAKEPWDKEVREYLAELDPDADLALLARCCPALSEESRLLYWAATRLVQLAAAADWTPYDIGTAVYRPDFDTAQPSALEQIVLFAHRAVDVRSVRAPDPDATPLALYLQWHIPDLAPLDIRDAEALANNSNRVTPTNSHHSLSALELTPARKSDDEASDTTSTTPTVSSCTAAAPRVFQLLLDSEDEADTVQTLKCTVESAIKQLISAGPAAAGHLFLI